MRKRRELTTEAKILFGGILLVIIIIIAVIIFTGKKEINRIAIEMVSPNEGIIVEDPVLGSSVELKVGKKIRLANTLFPEKHKKAETEYIVEDNEIAYVDEENNIVGKKAGTTVVYMQTIDGTVKSNRIEITIVE